MVMHARKPQRMNDGYFEKHQAHPYQNSKYSSSKGSSYGSSGGERYDRIRDSPNGNSYRSDSPDSQSPRDRDRGERAYQSKGSYLQKMREKERENRDYKMSRDKYSDCARSPKDKRSRESRDTEHRTNHDRSDDKLLLKMTSQNSSRDRKPMHNCQEKVREREDRERLTRVGDWSEHISSSGKKYYYNCKTEVSQWEKPREWIEREQRDRDRFSSSSNRNKERSSGGGGDIPSSTESRGYSSSGRSGGGGGGGSGGGGSGGNSSHDKHSNSRGVKRHWRDDPELVHHDPRRKHSTVTDGDIQSTQDMDISPGDSTPTSEVSYVHTPSTSNRDQSSLIIPSSTSGGCDDSSSTVTTPLTPVLLATALPRLQHQQSNTSCSSASGSVPVVSPSIIDHAHMLTPSMVPPPTAGVTSCNTPGPPQSPVITALPKFISQQQSLKNQHQDQDAANGDACGKSLQMLGQQRSTSIDGCSVSSLTQHQDHSSDGPPTPTHSETQDCLDPRKQLSSIVVTNTNNTITTSPCVSAATTPSSINNSGGTTVASAVSVATSCSLSSLQHVNTCTSSLSALRPQGPCITPSLANYYRDDLVNHVRGWPADILEKQAQKLSEEAHVMGSLQCTKVSAELKSARSIVRLTEIQATLQEQRILFLRQQIKMLEDMKSQNSFMSDDS